MSKASLFPLAGISRREFLVRSAAGGATVLGAATLAMPAVFSQEDTIRVGFPAPVTGAFGAEAKDQVRAAELAIREFNQAGGLNGRKAELLVRDDKLDPSEAATRALELIEKGKAHFIVGALSASVQLDEMADLFIEMRQTGTTLLPVEQNVEMTLELADRAYIPDHGEVVHEGTGQALLADEAIQKRYCSV